jgi:hypothetical protein
VLREEREKSSKKKKDEASMKMIFLFNHVGKNRWEIVKVFFFISSSKQKRNT